MSGSGVPTPKRPGPAGTERRACGGGAALPEAGRRAVSGSAVAAGGSPRLGGVGAGGVAQGDRLEKNPVGQVQYALFGKQLKALSYQISELYLQQNFLSRPSDRLVSLQYP